MTETPLQRWDRRAEWPLAALAVAFLVLYSIEVLVEPQGRAAHLISWSLDLLYIPFVVDYIARLRLADHRLQWFLRHPLDLAVVTLPFLRPLRFLRLVALARILQRAIGDAVRGRLIAFTVVGGSLLVYAAALAELKAERYAPGAQITTFPDSLWWAMATLTTVGYGDHVPVTHTGRAVAVLLMIGGICLIGVATATVAHWIITEVGKQDVADQAATVAHIDSLREEVRALQKLVNQQSAVAAETLPSGGAASITYVPTDASAPSAPGVPRAVG